MVVLLRGKMEDIEVNRTSASICLPLSDPCALRAFPAATLGTEGKSPPSPAQSRDQPGAFFVLLLPGCAVNPSSTLGKQGPRLSIPCSLKEDSTHL
jgi:hypothetical protein